MKVNRNHEPRSCSTVSADGTVIGYLSVGHGPGLIIVGGVLTSATDYLALALDLAADFEVHVVDRRGRPTTGPQRPDHSLEDECADLVAVAEATGATAVLGHSFGGLIALETARRYPIFDELFLYEPGVPLCGRWRYDWLAGYEELLERGKRRGAFAWMVKQNGFAPKPLAVLPLWAVRAILRLAIRGPEWASMEPLLGANLVEHRIAAALDSPSADRFSGITSHTVVLHGSKSPPHIGGQIAAELAAAIPDGVVATLANLGHVAPQQQPDRVGGAIRAHRRESTKQESARTVNRLPTPGSGLG